MTAGDGKPSAEQQRKFRWLFLTYPAAWRAEHEDVVLDTLLSLHAENGTSRPTMLERIQLAVDGLRVRIAASRRRPPTRAFATPMALAPLRTFDQTNGLIADARALDEREQVHANAAAGNNSDEQRVAPSAWFRLDAASRPDRHHHRRTH